MIIKRFLLANYAASYYCYEYSRAYAHDLFAKIKEHGLLSSEVGKRYVECILQPGGSRDPMESLELFLGRKPSIDAYIRYLQKY